LRRGSALTRHVTYRDLTFLDWPDRLSCHPIEDKREARFGDQSYRIDDTSIHFYGDKIRGGWWVIVPDPVMYGLKVPDTLTGSRV
jgi:hypothetical protein